MRELWITGHRVELPEMLSGRETRARLQKQILDFCPDSVLICFTLNIAGPVKVTALTNEAFFAGVEAIEDALRLAGIRAEEKIYEYSYGNEAYFVIPEEDQAAEDVKRLMTLIEEEHELGRLFDIDVIKKNGLKISRTDIGMEGRLCLLCDRPAAECASTRKHSVEELQACTTEMIFDYLRGEMNGGVVSRMAFTSMMNEIAVTPKPGLVDLSNNGSHKDMNPALFEKSANAIKEYFGVCYETGKRLRDMPADEILPNIRGLGVETEKKMFAATGNVNTHKGAIFSLGILCAAWGCSGSFDPEKIMSVSAKIARPIVHESGLRGIAGGARTQAASGFESVRTLSLPAFDEALGSGLDINTACVYALLCLIGNITDTNMISRGGYELAEEMKQRAGRLAGEFKTPDFLKRTAELDKIFIEKNLSPGGSADLLMLTLFCRMIKDIGR